MTYQLLPPLSPDDYEALKADIAERGVQVAVEYDDQGNVIDGHHRVRACADLGLTDWPRMVRSYPDEAAKRTQARKLNLARRHLDQAAKQALIEAEVRERPDVAPTIIADELGVDDNTVRTVRNNLEATFEIQKLEKTVGKDGKSRPTSYKPRSIGIHLPGEDGKRAVVASAVRASEPELTEADVAKAGELAGAKAAAEEKLATRPSPQEALEQSKTGGGWVKGSDGVMHLYVPPEQTQQYEVWLTMKPHVMALAEPAHSAEEFAASADDFWRPRFAAHLSQAIAYLEAVRRNLEVGR